MKAGYDIINSIGNRSKAIAVINDKIDNYVINLGWHYLRTAYLTKDYNTVGVWKIKKLKN